MLVGDVAFAVGGKANTTDDAAGIGIDNKDGFIGSVKDYRVGSFLPNAVDAEKLLAPMFSIVGKKPGEVVIVAFAQPVAK